MEKDSEFGHTMSGAPAPWYDRINRITERFAQAAKHDNAVDAMILKDVLFHAGPQWGNRSAEDILAAIDAAGFMIVRKPNAARSAPVAPEPA